MLLYAEWVMTSREHPWWWLSITDLIFFLSLIQPRVHMHSFSASGTQWRQVSLLFSPTGSQIYWRVSWCLWKNIQKIDLPLLVLLLVISGLIITYVEVSHQCPNQILFIHLAIWFSIITNLWQTLPFYYYLLPPTQKANSSIFLYQSPQLVSILYTSQLKAQQCFLLIPINLRLQFALLSLVDYRHQGKTMWTWLRCPMITTGMALFYLTERKRQNYRLHSSL